MVESLDWPLTGVTEVEPLRSPANRRARRATRYQIHAPNVKNIIAVASGRGSVIDHGRLIWRWHWRLKVLLLVCWMPISMALATDDDGYRRSS